MGHGDIELKINKQGSMSKVTLSVWIIPDIMTKKLFVLLLANDKNPNSKFVSTTEHYL